jgi:hypothetical protein
VVVSDALPLAGSLYQASKLVAAVAPVVAPDGLVVVAAECPLGVGPLDTVNDKIYAIGIRPRLAAGCRIALVSGLPRAEVERTYCSFAPTVEAALEGAAAPLVYPHAGSMIVTAEAPAG